MPAETNLHSFVLRFVTDPPDGDHASAPAAWHGVVRHVQSDEERPFAQWADAVAFIAQYVDLHNAVDAANQPINQPPHQHKETP